MGQPYAPAPCAPAHTADCRKLELGRSTQHSSLLQATSSELVSSELSTAVSVSVAHSHPALAPTDSSGPVVKDAAHLGRDATITIQPTSAPLQPQSLGASAAFSGDSLPAQASVCTSAAGGLSTVVCRQDLSLVAFHARHSLGIPALVASTGGAGVTASICSNPESATHNTCSEDICTAEGSAAGTFIPSTSMSCWHKHQKSPGNMLACQHEICLVAFTARC